jgi:hypothetical protein
MAVLSWRADVLTLISSRCHRWLSAVWLCSCPRDSRCGLAVLSCRADVLTLISFVTASLP